METGVSQAAHCHHCLRSSPCSTNACIRANSPGLSPPHHPELLCSMPAHSLRWPWASEHPVCSSSQKRSLQPGFLPPGPHLLHCSLELPIPVPSPTWFRAVEVTSVCSEHFPHLPRYHMEVPVDEFTSRCSNVMGGSWLFSHEGTMNL